MKQKQQIKDNHHTWQEVMDKKKMENKEGLILGSKKEGSTTIGFIPRERFVVVFIGKEYNEQLKTKEKTGLILATDLSDKELLKYGGTTKSAQKANQSGEDMEIDELLAVGSNCDYNVGDMVIFRQACQPSGLKLKGNYYLIYGEHDILGKMV